MTRLLCIFTLLLAGAQSASAQFNVHEWGTFTTLHGSNGGSLSGLFIEEEQLPPFVYHFPGFSPDSSILTQGYRPCTNATVKMETPVLYFYTQSELPIEVKVDFPRGAVTQWYPERFAGEPMPADGPIDFGNPERVGSISWKATVLAPDTKERWTHERDAFEDKWRTARQTTSNLVKNFNGEIEKYLFYRGLANFSLPVEVKFLDSTHVFVKNNGALDIPFVYVYDNTGNMQMIWGTGPLAKGESKVFERSNATYNNPSLFRQALVDAGLTFEEAESMIATWWIGYFNTTGFKVFWIVPRVMTDQLLPLSVTPTPDSIERVLVAKTEIITPQEEAAMLAYYQEHKNLDPWKDSYYINAYQQRVAELTEQLSVNPEELSFSLGGGCMRVTSPEPGFIKVVDVLGRVVLRTQEVREVSLTGLPQGVYFVRVSDRHGRTRGSLKVQL